MSKKSTDTKQTPYLVDKLSSIPASVKIGFLKFWLVGAVFFAVVNGLPVRFDVLDRLVIYYLLLVLGVEYISNTIILWMDTDQIPTKMHLPHEVNRRSFLSIPATAGYVLIMMLATYFFLEFWVSLSLPTIGDIISQSTSDPFSFALVFLIFDYLWIQARNLIKHWSKKESKHD
ncbi:MAG: hypothetical protein IH571_02040 [Acholeplasmataceae bacterium]|nr:hypothetical protein [Acholeplasmataceae bacterium]